MTKKRVWAAALTVLAAISLFPVTSFAAPQNVAEVEGIGYETLQKAIEAAPEGSTVTLLLDVTENVNFNKNITVDGAGKYTVAGLSSVSAGHAAKSYTQAKRYRRKGQTADTRQRRERLLLP